MVSRRAVLKAGGLSVVTTSLAGCSGRDGGGGGGGTTSSEELETVRITLGPGGFAGMVRQHLTDDTDILESRMNEAGYTAEVQETWQGATQFAAGGPDFSNIGTIEAARLASERELNIAVVARVAANWAGMFVRPGSDYDPEVAGGKEEAFSALAEDDALVGIGSWGGGDYPGHQILASDMGLRFEREDSDFNIQTANYGALGQLVADGDLDASSTGPVLGAVDLVRNGEIVPIYYPADYLSERGFGEMNINTWVTTQEFVDENRGAAEALVQAWYEGTSWLHENALSVVEDDQWWGGIGAESEEGAKWMVEYGLFNEHSLRSPYIYEEPELSDEYVEGDEALLEAAAGLGTIPENWADYLTYAQIPQE